MIRSPEDMTWAPEQRTMDALSDVLRVAQLSGGVFLNAHFTAPWCMAARISPEICAPFLGSSAHFIPYHYVVAGELRVALQEQEPVLLCAGECVLFPRNDLHLMCSDLTLPATSVREILAGRQGAGPHHIRHGGGGAATQLICGYLGCVSARGNPVFASLPRLVHIRAGGGGSTDWFRA